MTEPETDEQRADRLETERKHAAGIHTHCGVTCETDCPSDMLRNFIVAKGYPGTAGALDELLRRASQPAPAVPTTTGRPCGQQKPHPNHTFMRMEVLFQCPGIAAGQPVPAVSGDLRQQLVDAIRAAAYSCDGECGMDEVECEAARPVQVAGWTHGVVSDVYAPITALADAVLPVVRTAETTARVAALNEAADEAERLRQFEKTTGARAAAQVSENVGILRVADHFRRVAAEAQPATTTAPSCEWPTCLPEEEQQQLADGVLRQMRGHTAPAGGEEQR